jgi:hypothetical protein
MKTWKIAVPAATLTLAMSNAAQSTPQYFPGTGHYYEVIADFTGIPWSEARADAESRVWQGQQGYLACITSAEENQFVFDLSVSSGVWYPASIWYVGPWLGGFQESGADEPEGGWTWVSGEPWNYANWLAGQPDDDGPPPAHENFLLFWGRGQITPTWNDYLDVPPSGGDVHGYVVEFPTAPLPPVGACCFPAGVCLQGTQVDCQMAGGYYVGDGTQCHPSPCEPTSVEASTWGRVKASYRE